MRLRTSPRQLVWPDQTLGPLGRSAQGAPPIRLIAAPAACVTWEAAAPKKKSGGGVQIKWHRGWVARKLPVLPMFPLGTLPFSLGICEAFALGIPWTAGHS